MQEQPRRLEMSDSNPRFMVTRDAVKLTYAELNPPAGHPFLIDSHLTVNPKPEPFERSTSVELVCIWSDMDPNGHRDNGLNHDDDISIPFNPPYSI
jgi:hypothetical protein